MSESNELPKGWASCLLGDVTTVIRGVTYSKDLASNSPMPGFIPILRATNINTNLTFDELVYVAPKCVSSEQMLCSGDIIVAASSGSKSIVGKAAHFNGGWEGSFGAFCMGLRPVGQVNTRFIGYFLQTDEYRHKVSELSAGSNINNLKRDHLQSFPFRLAPLNEQRRIVTKIEELFSDLDAGVAALQRAKANLKRYRASVLKAAVEGKLTEEWRAKHPTTEPGSILLARILKGRRQKWEADQLAKFAAAEKEPPKNWREKYVEPSPPITTGLPELPEGWCWTRMELLACDKANSIGAGPFGTIFKAHDFRPEGIPIIFLRHVQPGVYLTRKPGFMDQQKWEELFKNEYSVFGGELLVTKLGEPPGTAAIYPNELGPAMVTPDVIKMLPSNDVVLTEFVMYYMNSSIGRAFSSGVAFGTTRLRLTLPLFKDLPVPLPPLEEQTEIVAEIAEAFSQIEAAETAIEHGLLRASRLRQSILKQAFEGKLVPQDPKDEPASVLLKRLQASRSVHEGNGKAGTQNRTRGRRAKSKQLEGRADE